MNEQKDFSCQSWGSFWEKEFNLPVEIGYHRSTREPFYKLLNRNILSLSDRKELRILEIGCGTAIDSCILANMNNIRIFCLDLFFSAVKLAQRISREFNAPLLFVNCDAKRICFKDKTFDLVFSQGVLEHFHDLDPVMEEQLRLLKDGGILIIDVPQTYTLCTLVKQRMIKKGKWPYGWETQFSYRDLLLLGRRFGLQAIDVCGHQHDSYIRFFNFVLFRNIIKRVQKYNPLRERPLFRKIELGYDRLWNWLERRYGHYFLVNIAVAFKKKRNL